MTHSVDQSSARAKRDIIGRDSIGSVTNNYIQSSAKKMEMLMEKLASEIANSEETRQQIDTLQLYLERRSHDGVDGLEAKLDHSGRSDTKIDAYAKKELFVKLLNRYSLYASAQEIFAFMLARADSRFNATVLPHVDDLSIAEIDQIVITNIVEPIVEEVGCGPFNVNDAIVTGMVYWLAEQCFVRWHK